MFENSSARLDIGKFCIDKSAIEECYVSHKEITESCIKESAVRVNLVIHGGVEIAVAIRSITGDNLVSKMIFFVTRMKALDIDKDLPCYGNSIQQMFPWNALK